MPYIPILDLAICFYYAFDEAGVDNGMIPIYRSHLDNWKVTDRDLLEIAVKNTPRLFPGETIPMEDVLGDTLQELPEEVRREFLRKVSMMILTNSRKTYGACSILYPGMLEQLAERNGGDYYMIPSSVHEFLLVPREREQDRETEENDRRSEPDGAAAGGSSVGPFISVLQPGEGSKDSVEYRSEYYV